MTRKKVDLKKHTFNLREGDFDRIQEAYPREHASVIIRLIISAYVDNKLGMRETLKIPVKLEEL